MGEHVTIGDVRQFLARSGVPHTEATHYLIIARAPGSFHLHGCCDDVESSVGLAREAIGQMTGQLPPEAPDSPFVIVGREDLRAVLAEGIVPGDVRDRLVAAAEAGHA
jgi:hypothetical protein